MVNITNALTTSAYPSRSTLPTTLLAYQFDGTQYAYASPSGSTNDVNGGFPRFLGIVRLAVTLAAGAATWTGLGAGNDGQQVILRNADNTNTLTLSTGGTGLGDAASLPANQFTGQNDYRLPPGGQITILYNGGVTPHWSIG